MNTLAVIIPIISIIIILSFIYFSKFSRPIKLVVIISFFTISIISIIALYFIIKNKDMKESICVVLSTLVILFILFFWLIMLKNRCSSNYTPSYETYCGDGNVPAQYNRRGTASECLRKGIGVGRCMNWKF